MPRIMQSTPNPIGNAAIASSPDFSGAGAGGDAPRPITKEDNDAVDALMDQTGLQDQDVGTEKNTQLDKAKGITSKEGQGLEKSKEDEPPKLPTEPKAEPTPTPEKTVTPAPAQTPAAPQPPKDEEIDGIPEPKGLNPANKDNFKKLRETAKRYKSELGAVKKQYEDAQGTLARLHGQIGKLPDEVQKELNDLRQFQRAYDLEGDKEFQTKFVQPLEKTSASIFALLKGQALPDEKMDEIKNTGIDNYPMAEWERYIDILTSSEHKKDREDGIRLRQLVNQHEEQLLNKKTEIQNGIKGKSEFITAREEAQKTERANEHQFVDTELKKLEKAFPVLQRAQLPPNATPEQAKEINEHNAFIQETEQRFVKYYAPKTPQDKMDAAVSACYAYLADRELIKAEASMKAKDERITALEAQLGKINNSTRMPKDNVAPAATGKKNGITDYIGMRPVDAVEKAMADAGI